MATKTTKKAPKVNRIQRLQGKADKTFDTGSIVLNYELLASNDDKSLSDLLEDLQMAYDALEEIIEETKAETVEQLKERIFAARVGAI